MRKIIDNNNFIEILNKDNHSLPFIISIPHSGIFLTEELISNLKDKVILPNTDWYLQDLYSFLQELGYTVIINNMSRYVIDPNRSLTDNNPSFWHSAIYTKTTYGKEMYKNELTEDVKKERIKYYNEYHSNLENLINNKLKYFKKVYLIDLHSFATPLPYDIILGNNYDTTSSIDFKNKLFKLFKKEGFKVGCNKKFIGGYIVKHYKDKCEAIQIEINYRKYIENRSFYEEENPSINEKLFKQTKKSLKIIFEDLEKFFKNLNI